MLETSFISSSPAFVSVALPLGGGYLVEFFSLANLLLPWKLSLHACWVHCLRYSDIGGWAVCGQMEPPLSFWDWE